MGSIRNSRDNSSDPEFLLMKKVDAGTIMDSEIAAIERGGGEALKFMEQKADKLEKEVQHLNNVYGKGSFDGVDNDGNPTKDISINNF